VNFFIERWWIFGTVANPGECFWRFAVPHWVLRSRLPCFALERLHVRCTCFVRDHEFPSRNSRTLEQAYA
jgi:hypothetical protein